VNNTLYNGTFFSPFAPSSMPSPPTVASATVNSAGTHITIVFIEAAFPPVLPASGATGFTLAATGGVVTISAPAISSLTYTATLSRTIQFDESLTLAYAPGNVTNSNSPVDNLVAFSGFHVTNNSTQVPPMTVPAVYLYTSDSPGTGIY
jgi:hypothetical protein